MTAHIHLPFTSAAIDRMAWTIADIGIAGLNPVTLREFAASARRAGVCTTLAGLLTDTNAAPVARERAFGKVAAAINARRNGELTLAAA